MSMARYNRRSFLTLFGFWVTRACLKHEKAMSESIFWRPSTGEWFILSSENNFSFSFGTNGDIPGPADFDNDGKADPAVFRPSTGTWFIQRSSDSGTTIVQFGANGDVTVAADYDGDGRADFAI